MSYVAPGPATATRPPGLIDTLQSGFNTLNRHTWLLMIPIAVDLVLWLGPQVSIGPLLERWLVSATTPPGIDAGVAASFEETRRAWLEAVRQGGLINRFNLLALLVLPALLLSLALPFRGIPSFRAATPPEGPVLALGNWSQAVGIGLICVLLGLLLAVVLYGLLGQAVRTGRAVPQTFVGDLGRLYVWTLLLAALLGTTVVAVGIPLVALLGAAGGAPAGAFVVPVVLGVVLWIYFYVFFTTDALFVGRVPPLVAIRHSITVVRYNFWSTLVLIALLMIISEGFPRLWAELARGLGPPGVALAIVGHSYISTGLTAASMTYYKERYERLRST